MSYKTFHPQITEYTFFSSAYGMSSRTDHMLGHRTSLNKFKIEIISSIFFYDQNSMKLEINYKKKNGKRTNTWRLHNTLLKTIGTGWNQRGNQKVPQDKCKWKHNFPKSIRCNKSSSNREVSANTGLSQETRKILHKTSYHLKALEKE